ncbi:App1 family protein [uncultured Maribacter sp.]|uniref:App1 family protein n=1 Tax=uncultured Maribacter sp. TaxID=431308 RepID=UPI002633B307|nr:phosphatase domain-containing protein [uncultured Maribacter sp.]
MGIFKKDKLQIINFQSYGSANRLYVRGRAIEDENIDLDQKGFFNLIKNTWKRFETDEIKNAPLKITFSNGETVEGTTDGDGYYLIDENIEGLQDLANDEGWVKFELSFGNTNLKREILLQNRFPGEMLIPCKQAKFGVISDIDDTILHTGVVSSLKWKVIINTMFKRATKRAQLEGASDFYTKLHQGKTGNDANPIFYVSHSPWNLYRYLELFLKTNNFPKGPVLLRSMASFKRRKKSDEKPQKQKEISNLLKSYPELPFILIGDSGEKDGDIYQEISMLFPGRIKAIYLRSVNHSKRMARIENLFADFKDIPFLMVNKTAEAIDHAKKNGFI